jgi:hypothetical protein
MTPEQPQFLMEKGGRYYGQYLNRRIFSKECPISKLTFDILRFLAGYWELKSFNLYFKEIQHVFALASFTKPSQFVNDLAGDHLWVKIGRFVGHNQAFFGDTPNLVDSCGIQDKSDVMLAGGNDVNGLFGDA